MPFVAYMAVLGLRAAFANSRLFSYSAPHAVIQTKDNKRVEKNMRSLKMNSSEMSQGYNSIFVTVLKSSQHVKYIFSNLLHPFVNTKHLH